MTGVAPWDIRGKLAGYLTGELGLAAANHELVEIVLRQCTDADKPDRPQVTALVERTLLAAKAGEIAPYQAFGTLFKAELAASSGPDALEIYLLASMPPENDATR